MADFNEQRKLILPFIQRADEVQSVNPKMAYYCRLYAVEQMAKMTNRAKEITGVLLALMDRLEKDKASLTLNAEADKDYCTAFALKVFDNADKVDRAGRASADTAKAYYASSFFIEVLTQFGLLDKDVADKQRYAAWRAAELRKAIREGRPPVPPPSNMADLPSADDVEAAMLASMGAAQGASTSGAGPSSSSSAPLPSSSTSGLPSSDSISYSGPSDTPSASSLPYSPVTGQPHHSSMSGQPPYPSMTGQPPYPSMKGQLPLPPGLLGSSLPAAMPDNMRNLSMHQKPSSSSLDAWLPDEPSAPLPPSAGSQPGSGPSSPGTATQATSSGRGSSGGGAGGSPIAKRFQPGSQVLYQDNSMHAPEAGTIGQVYVSPSGAPRYKVALRERLVEAADNEVASRVAEGEAITYCPSPNAMEPATVIMLQDMSWPPIYLLRTASGKEVSASASEVSSLPPGAVQGLAGGAPAPPPPPSASYSPSSSLSHPVAPPRGGLLPLAGGSNQPLQPPVAPAASPPPPPPPSTARPAQPAPPPANFHQPAPSYPAAAGSAGCSGMAHPSNGGYPVPGFVPGLLAINEAQKYAKYAVSSLGFEDIPTAIKNLTDALRLLTQPK